MAPNALRFINWAGMLATPVLSYFIWEEGFPGYAIALVTGLLVLKGSRWIRTSRSLRWGGLRSEIENMTPGARMHVFAVIVFVTSMIGSKPLQIMLSFVFIFGSLTCYVLYLRRRQVP